MRQEATWTTRNWHLRSAPGGAGGWLPIKLCVEHRADVDVLRTHRADMVAKRWYFGKPRKDNTPDER